MIKKDPLENNKAGEGALEGKSQEAQILGLALLLAEGVTLT